MCKDCDLFVNEFGKTGWKNDKFSKPRKFEFMLVGINHNLSRFYPLSFHGFYQRFLLNFKVFFVAFNRIFASITTKYSFIYIVIINLIIKKPKTTMIFNHKRSHI